MFFAFALCSLLQLPDSPVVVFECGVDGLTGILALQQAACTGEMLVLDYPEFFTIVKPV